MGRTNPSAGLPPAAFRKDARAKKAKATINKTIPSLLSAHPRARNGVASTELITPDSLASATQTIGASRPRIKLRITTTLSAARTLLTSQAGAPTQTPSQNANPDLTNRARVAILNMASPLSPGGGFLNGASSQEEYLCMRTTLLPALRDEFYRLPELSAVFTPNVLVFRDDEGEDLPKRERWFVDVVTAGMLRQPEVDDDGRYVSDKDREMVRNKMKLVMRVLGSKGVKRVILGAWGCGAYGNPVGEVARAWRGVLLSEKREGWEGVDDIVFSIKERGMAERFAEAFGEGLVVEEGDDGTSGEGEDQQATEIRDLEEKIREMELAVEQAKSPQLKTGLSRAVAGLKDQLNRMKVDDGEGASGG